MMKIPCLGKLHLDTIEVASVMGNSSKSFNLMLIG